MEGLLGFFNDLL